MRTSRPTELHPGGPPPAKLRGARAELLLELKRAGSATASDLAGALHCSLNAVRHHLKELQREGAVLHDRTHHGVGAPAHTYRLSPLGHDLFPQRHASTIAFLLDQLVALEGRAVSAALVNDHVSGTADRVCAIGNAADRDRRGQQIADALDAEGYMATWEQGEDGGVLIEHNCPHRPIAERFPEICRAEEAFLGRAFGAAVTRQSQISGGCGTCTYRVSYDAVQGGGAGES